MKAHILGLIGGGIGGFVVGHVLAALLGTRSKEDQNVPSQMFIFTVALLVAIIVPWRAFTECPTRPILSGQRADTEPRLT